MLKGTDREVRVLDGSTFFVSDGYGDCYGGPATQGLFFKDTRFLAVEELRIDGQRPALLSTNEVDYFSASFYLTQPPGRAFADHQLSIVRNRFVGRGVHEDILLGNFSDDPLETTLSLTFDCDFADIFAIKSGQAPRGRPAISADPANGRLVFDYQVAGLRRKTMIDCGPDARIDGTVVTIAARIEPRSWWKRCIIIRPVWEDSVLEPKYGCNSFGLAQPEMAESLKAWRERLPELDTDNHHLLHTFERSLVDLAALRFYPEPDDHPVLAAGLPWFMALFGRDNLLAAYQCCYLAPDIAACVLRTLARRQGTKVDDFRDEQPGKILHEQRFGELTLLGESPHDPYYGSVDATGLFLILLHETYRWTGDRTLVTELQEPALRALEWIDRHGDLDGDGYVEYQKRSPKGLDNQGWKDSWNSVLFADGRLAEPPIALCEVQGYVYDAKIRTAALAQEVWGDRQLSQRLRAEAVDLKERFNRDFWIADRGGYFALALDREKHQVDAKTSNMGQLLWSGIASQDKARCVARQLMGEALYSGWGIRTMSSEDRGFNPIAYHNGTIWPHDNSLIAAGLARYGFRKEAGRIAKDLIAAAQFFDYRLPEAFAGYQRARIDFPVEYPTSSSPQAWATGAPLLLLRTMLGLEPDLKNRRLIVDPLLPDGISRVALRHLRAFGKPVDVEVSPRSRISDFVSRMTRRSAPREIK